MQAAFVLGACGILFALATLHLPLTLAPGETPFENGRLKSISPAYALLTEAAAVIPGGASVVPITEPRSALAETYFYQAAVGLMPRQKVFPAARWGTPTPEYERQGEYVIVLGRRGTISGAELFFRSTVGTVWRRAMP